MELHNLLEERTHKEMCLHIVFCWEETFLFIPDSDLIQGTVRKEKCGNFLWNLSKTQVSYLSPSFFGLSHTHNSHLTLTEAFSSVQP